MPRSIAAKLSDINDAVPQYWATPKCLLFDWNEIKTHIVPVAIESNPTSYISVRDLNVDHWLADGSDGESFKPGERHAHAITAWPRGRIKEQNARFFVHYTPQEPPFTARNKAVMVASRRTIRNWYGNVMVAKLTPAGHVIDMNKRDVGLIETMVVRTMMENRVLARGVVNTKGYNIPATVG